MNTQNKKGGLGVGGGGGVTGNKREGKTIIK
jgi:hypothetical protein